MACRGRGPQPAEVAVKRLHVQRHLTDDELATLHERTRREARSAARIAHSHVVVVHDVVDDEGLPCIVMEYVPSTTLAALLADGGAVPPTEAARIGLGMVTALRAAHVAGRCTVNVKRATSCSAPTAASSSPTSASPWRPAPRR